MEHLEEDVQVHHIMLFHGHPLDQVEVSKLVKQKINNSFQVST
jgi:hypothetical protein